MKQTLKISVVDAAGSVVASSKGETLTLRRVYQRGDRIVVESDIYPTPLKLRLDETMTSSLIWLTAHRMEYPVPFGMEAEAYAPEAFAGEQHTVRAEYADETEWRAYRNLSENAHDCRGESVCYPHCTANAETRGESVFAARNVIDGQLANTSHGHWPYTSWGEDERPDACIRIDLGREVAVDCIRILIRADFPHDNYWTKCTLRLSDGTKRVLPMRKTATFQEYRIPESVISWAELSDFVRGEDPSPFPALTEWEIWGREI